MQRNQVDYLLCNVLYNLASVLESFPNKEIQKEIDQTLLQIQNKCLNVAIIGEFRRGKSSLINALLGMPILPVDIEPTTASINRVTYGLKPKAVVHFKDGTSIEVPIGDLSSYVTKLTPDSARIAATVREAEIQYPTELCSNHIDIIDTPGLNDTESMTCVTESLLDYIQMAVVAVKSTMPYSETECSWVVRLLALPKLSNIVFVLTCMDLIKKTDFEKVLTYTKKRISEKTLEKVREQYGDDAEMMIKAKRLFCENNIKLYPVSAVLALDSFDNGDYELLAESNISSLKKGLLTTMNAEQQMAGVYATESLVDRFSAWFSCVSVEEHSKMLSDKINDLSKADEVINTYFTERSKIVEKVKNSISWEIGGKMAAHLSEANLENAIKEVFVKHLNQVKVISSEAFVCALRNAETEVVDSLLPQMYDVLSKSINAIIIRNINEYFSQREDSIRYRDYQDLIDESSIPSSDFLRGLILEYLRGGIEIDTPRFSISVPSFIMSQNVVQSLLNPYINIFAKKYRKAWQNALPEYTQMWYSIVLKAEPIEMTASFRNVIFRHKGAVAEKISFLEMQYSRAKQLIDNESEKIRQLKKELLK